jgi:hypothetical protein
MKRHSGKKKRESHYQAIVKKYVSQKYGCTTVRELNFGGPTFDVVGFSPDSGEFHIVECKNTFRLVGVGKTFGQILAYKSMIFDAGEKFLNSFLRKLTKEGITDLPLYSNVARFVDAGKIPIRFYVALHEEACSRPDMLKLMKRDLKSVGIIRINAHEQCKDYIRVRGEKDFTLCDAARVDVPIATPPRPVVQNVLDHQGSSPDVADLTAVFDSRILKMRKRVKSVPHGHYAILYSIKKNFVGLHPKKHFVRVSIKESNNWKEIRVNDKRKLRSIYKQIRKALNRSLAG